MCQTFRRAEDAEITKLKEEIAALCDQIDSLTETDTHNQEMISSLKSTVEELTVSVSTAEEKVLVSIRAKEDVESNLSRALETKLALEKVLTELKAEQRELQLQVEALTNQLTAEKMESYSSTSQDVNISSLPLSSGTSAMLARTRTVNNQIPYKSKHQDKKSLVSSGEGEEGSGDERDRSGSLISVDLQTDDAGKSSSSNSNIKRHYSHEGSVNTSNLMAVNEVRHCFEC